MREVRTRRDSLTGWLAIGVAVVLVAAGSWSYLASETTSEEREVAHLRDEGRLIEARWTLERAGLDLLVAGMLDGFGIREVPEERRDDAAERIRFAAGELADLSTTEGTASLRAEIVGDVLVDEVTSDPIGADLIDIYESVNDVRWADEQLPVETRFDALFELGFVAALPDHMLVEALVAFASVEDLPIDAELEAAFDEVLEVVREDGGWLAVDPPTPLSDSEWFEIANAQSEFPVETAAAEGLIGSTALVDFDAWMRDFVATPEPPPLSVDELLEVVEEVRAGVVGFVDPVLDVEVDAAVAELESAIDADRRLRTLAIVLVAAAVALAAFGVVRLVAARRTTRQLSDLALRDALTGVSNRHALDETVRSSLTASRFEHHVVVMIDLDRFKMVNDLYGHAAGDAVLIEVGTRLRGIVDAVCDATPGAIGDVVRLGGDEFLLAVHAPGDVAIDEVRSRLDRARSEPLALDVDGVTEFLVPDFSVGLVDCRGRGDLDELMTAADLAAYADKERRAFAGARAFQTDGSSEPTTS